MYDVDRRIEAAKRRHRREIEEIRRGDSVPDNIRVYNQHATAAALKAHRATEHLDDAAYAARALWNKRPTSENKTAFREAEAAYWRAHKKASEEYRREMEDAMQTYLRPPTDGT